MSILLCDIPIILEAIIGLVTAFDIKADVLVSLACGTPKVIAVKSVDAYLSDEDVYALTASVEQLSEHPLGKAIVQSYHNCCGCDRGSGKRSVWTRFNTASSIDLSGI